MRQYLIADSGGSKTDWCFIDFRKTKTYFTTKSYHPFNCDDDFVNSEIKFWTSHDYMLNAQVFFFGAGCFNSQGKSHLEKVLFKIGFQNVTVKSDLHGAGLALFGNENGNVAILGTGSVLFDWEQHEVSNVIGGEGHLIGDEGSGFYFGKLVFEAYNENRLTDRQRSVFDSVANISLINKAIEKKIHKFILGDLSFRLREYRLLFNDFHLKNAELFCEKHLASKVTKDISVLGGYGYYNRDILRPIFNNFNYNGTIFLRRPIEALVEHIVFLNE
ncbi:MAG: hypothetical protein QNK85_10290 [Crocinitomicaceae bacterium]